jgi:hypothetical protein
MTVSTAFLALLAMDSYNQGYASEVTGDRPQIGDATRLAVDHPNGSVAAGFYATAYQLSDGTIVILYRGTDNMGGNAAAGGNDLTNGYPIGAGSYLGVTVTVHINCRRARFALTFAHVAGRLRRASIERARSARPMAHNNYGDMIRIA